MVVDLQSLVVDLQAVRAFVAVAETTQFQSAGRKLGISQQAVSKRIAALERELGLRLFARSPRGALLTIDGQALLPRARELLRAEARALAAIRPQARALRVDVINVRVGPAHLLRDFHRARPDVPLEVLTMFDATTALDAVRAGSVDATFRAAPLPGLPLPRGLVGMRAMDEGLMLLLGPRHPLASRANLCPAELTDHPIWMPSLVAGTEWAIYYAELSRALGISIDTSGPNFGSGEMLTAIERSATLATFMGAHTRPASLPSHDVRLLPLRDPTPAYPHSLIWHEDNTHPALALLRTHIDANAHRASENEIWTPA
jgi:DNA-binding transcriptional LysR family regulator